LKAVWQQDFARRKALSRLGTMSRCTDDRLRSAENGTIDGYSGQIQGSGLTAVRSHHDHAPVIPRKPDR